MSISNQIEQHEVMQKQKFINLKFKQNLKYFKM